MQKLFSFLKITLIGGLGVLLPLSLVLLIVQWLYRALSSGLSPLTYLIKIENPFLANLLALGILLIVCFLVGLGVKTKFGEKLYFFLEKTIFIKIPGFKISKNFAGKLTGGSSSIYSQAVLVKVSEIESKVGFIAEKNLNGTTTVFIPSAPDIVSGEIIIVSNSVLTPIHAPTQDVVNSLLSYGTNSNEWLKKDNGEERASGRLSS